MFYEHYYKARFEAAAYLSGAVAEELFNTGVNIGLHSRSFFFQTLLGRFIRRGRDDPNLKIDGHIGPKTLTAFCAFLKVLGRERDGDAQGAERAGGRPLCRRHPEADQNEGFIFGCGRPPATPSRLNGAATTL